MKEQHEVHTALQPPVVHPGEFLYSELSWIKDLIEFRIYELCKGTKKTTQPAPIVISSGLHSYFDWLIEQEVDGIERIALNLALATQCQPHLLDELYTKNEVTGKPFTEFGVQNQEDKPGLIPSWQTVVFLGLGSASGNQFELLRYTHPEYWLYKHKVLEQPDRPVSNPFLLPLKIEDKLLKYWLYPEDLPIPASQDFMAQLLKSDLAWSDLVLAEKSKKGIEQVRLWLRHGDQLLAHPEWKKHISPGIRVLFYGPSGTGKTLTATLLGQEFDMPVHRVDLSQTVSKWIGETEKNLARLFNESAHKDWILFFDEADALFARRTEVNHANDRRANQEVAYLLQRIENHPGTIIMASNLRDNIDEAFTRRFQHMIHFPLPDASHRRQLWENILKDSFPQAKDLDLNIIASNYELSGGTIKNVFRQLMLQLSEPANKSPFITHHHLQQLIEEEQEKEGIYQIRKRY